MELKQVIKVLKSKIWFIIMIILLGTTAAGVLSVYVIKPVYEASAKLILMSNGAVDGKLVNYDAHLANVMLIETYRDIVKTPGLMEKVVESYPSLKMTPEQLIQKVKVNSSNNQIMSVDVKDDTYDKAVQIANAVSNIMVQEIPKIMNIHNVSILDEAVSSNKPVPVTPNHAVNLSIGFIVSFILSISLVLIAEFLNDTMKSEEVIERDLGIAVLAVIPKMKNDEVYPMIRVISEERVGERSYVAIKQ